jgi:galactokinase
MSAGRDVEAAVRTSFQDRFGEAPAFMVRAPGRVNLIGEHTDYNDGFVLPIAIDREVWIALRPRADGRVVVHSLDYRDTADFDAAGVEHTGKGWVEYLKGVAWGLAEAGLAVRGWEGVLSGDVPRGAGLSSSAAVELATERAFAAVGDLPWDPAGMALLAQRVENRWIGVNCGIMDQMVVAAGQAGHALLIDCRTLDTTPAPLPADAAVVVLDTATRRGLVDSAYNERRAQCEAAARYFGVRALRDVEVATFEARADGLDPVTRRRARHVVTENERTLEAARAMRAGDVRRLGELMNASHASLRDDFEVTNDALDTIVSLAQARPGCHGARMTGAGFGGCAVALVDGAHADEFVARVTEGYRSATGRVPHCYVCHAADGASVEVGNGH